MTEKECRRMLHYMLGLLSPAEYDMPRKKKRKMARKNANIRKFRKVWNEYVVETLNDDVLR